MMTRELATIEELEEQAEQAGMRLGNSLSALKQNLRPTNLFTEWVGASGVTSLQASGWMGRRVRNHPLSTLVAGLAAGGLVGMALRRSTLGSSDHIVESRNGLKERFGQGFSSLAESAAQVIRERVDRKSAELMETARSGVQVGVDNASQALEGTIENLTRSSAPELARPIVSSLSQLLLFAFVETLIRRVASERSRVRN